MEFSIDLLTGSVKSFQIHIKNETEKKQLCDTADKITLTYKDTIAALQEKLKKLESENYDLKVELEDRNFELTQLKNIYMIKRHVGRPTKEEQEKNPTAPKRKIYKSSVVDKKQTKLK